MPAAKKAPVLTSIKTNPFAVQTMRSLPVTLLSKRRVTYGWEELKKPKQYKTFTREQMNNARQSAFGYGKDHNIEFRCIPATDEDGNVVTEKVYLHTYEVEGRKTPVTVEIPKSEYLEHKDEDGYREDDLPVNYWIVRVS